MAQQNIDTATNHGSYIGDPATTAFTKVNANFTENYAGIANVTNRLTDIGLLPTYLPVMSSVDNLTTSGFNRFTPDSAGVMPPSQNGYGTMISLSFAGDLYTQLAIGVESTELAFRYHSPTGWLGWARVWHSSNTTVDSNLFIKKAS